jgi:hypothetical protein
MSDVQAKIDKLLDSRFVTDLLALRSDEGCIAGHATGFYLEDTDLEFLRPLLHPAHHHADVGQIGCYRAMPVCPKAQLKENGQPVAEYQGILFSYWVYREVLPVSSFREWLCARKEDESKKRPAVDALDRYETLAEQSSIVKEVLAPIVEAARSRYFVSWDIGMRFLSRLAAKHSVAQEVMADLMMTGKAAEKVRVLGALWDHLPKSFCINLIRQGFRDRSKLVRQTAANVARCLILSEMVDALCQAATVERDPETKWHMEHAVALIRDGYHLYNLPDGTETFVVRISDGFPAELLYPVPGRCTDADIKLKGPKAVAEEIRRQTSGTDGTRREFKWPRE